ncbi:MAG: hypothetical protein KC636_19225 [Myxococcales bacterium]|nr:hypothetical protein [Myxococcales bacterium]
MTPLATLAPAPSRTSSSIPGVAWVTCNCSTLSRTSKLAMVPPVSVSASELGSPSESVPSPVPGVVLSEPAVASVLAAVSVPASVL